MSLSQAPVVFRLPPQVWNWWMFPSGIHAPAPADEEGRSLPASSSLSAEANSEGRR